MPRNPRNTRRPRRYYTALGFFSNLTQAEKAMLRANDPELRDIIISKDLIVLSPLMEQHLLDAGFTQERIDELKNAPTNP